MAWVFLFASAALSPAATLGAAEAAAARGDYAGSLRLYASIAEADPEGYEGTTAKARAAWLLRHAEGAFEPLRRLEALRRDPARSATRAAVEASAAEGDALPAGLVRAEWRVLLGEACLGRAAAPDRARALLLPVAEGEGNDPVLTRQAADLVLDADLAVGAYDDAEADLRRFGGADTVVRRVERLLRRHRLHRAAWGLTGAVGAWAALAVARGPRKEVARAALGFAPIAFAFAVVLAGGAVLVAGAVDEGVSAKPFLALGASAFGLVVAARAWGATKRGPRWGRALACAAASFAIAFLVLEGTDATYLESFGL